MPIYMPLYYGSFQCSVSPDIAKVISFRKLENLEEWVPLVHKFHANCKTMKQWQMYRLGEFKPVAGTPEALWRIWTILAKAEL